MCSSTAFRTSATWTPLLAALEQQHDCSPRRCWVTAVSEYSSVAATPAAMADALERDMDASAWRAHLVGNSLGGWLALELAVRGRRSRRPRWRRGGWTPRARAGDWAHVSTQRSGGQGLGPRAAQPCVAGFRAVALAIRRVRPADVPAACVEMTVAAADCVISRRCCAPGGSRFGQLARSTHRCRSCGHQDALALARLRRTFRRMIPDAGGSSFPDRPLPDARRRPAHHDTILALTRRTLG